MNNSMHSSFDHMLRRVLSTGFALVAGTALTHAETAYEALQTVGDKLGEESLERIVAVRGNHTGWTVSLLNPNSTAQLHEVRVRNKRVVSKTTEPSAGRILTPIDLDHLNLDSDGALKLANRHLQKTISASRVDYTLSTDVNRNVPVWVLKLRNPAPKEGTFLQIAANNGSITDNTSPAPIAAVGDETALEKPADSIAAVNEPPPRQAPESNAGASVEPGSELPADVGIEAAGEVPPADPRVEANDRPNVPRDGFRARRTTTRSKARSSRPPEIVEKVAGEVERKVRFVRRLIPF